MAYLGIDLGTSGLRALLINEKAEVLGAQEASFATRHPRDGWSEQNPADWIEALDQAMAKLRASHKEYSQIKAIAVAGHMHGATLLDAHAKVLRPCIMWNDTRSALEAAQLDGLAHSRELSGNIVFPGFTAPKLLWVEKHEPEIFAQIDKVLLPAAFLNHYLSGEFVGDMSDAAGTSWLDVGKRDWSDVLLQAGHMQKSQMPRLVEGSQKAGNLRPALAQKWGLSENVIIAGGAGDNAAAACGMGILNEGQGFVSLGTSGVLLAARDGYHPAAQTALHTFCHAVPKRWYQMGVMLSATASLNWLSQITGQSPKALTAELPETLSEPGFVQFLPYLSGERTPHNDAFIRGAFTGLGAATSRVDLTRAVLEGVAFAFADSFAAIKSSGAKLESLFAIGGGAASSYWLQLIATVLNIPLALPQAAESGAALGAARLAMAAHHAGNEEAIMQPPATAKIIAPIAELTSAYQLAYAKYKNLYPAIRQAQ